MSEAERAFRKLSRKSFWRTDHDWILGRFRIKYFGNSSSKQLDLNTEWSKNLPDTYMNSIQEPYAQSWRQRVKLALIHRWMQVYKIRSAFPRNDIYDLRDRYGEEEWLKMRRQFLLRSLLAVLVLYWAWGWLSEQWRSLRRYQRAKDSLYMVKQATYDRVRRASHDRSDDTGTGTCSGVGELDYSLLPYTAAAENASLNGVVSTAAAAATATATAERKEEKSA